MPKKYFLLNLIFVIGAVFAIFIFEFFCFNEGFLCMQKSNIAFAACKPIDVILVIDKSGSMADFIPGEVPPIAKMQAAKGASNNFIDLLSGDDHVGVVSFSDDAFLDQTLTDDKAAAKGAVNSLSPGGGTSTHKGIGAARLEFNSPRARSDSPSAMIILTDGRPDVPGLAISQASIAKNQGIRIIVIGYDIDSNSNPEATRTTLKTIASTPIAPDYQEASTAEELGNIYNSLAAQLCDSNPPEIASFSRSPSGIVFSRDDIKIASTATDNTDVNDWGLSNHRIEWTVDNWGTTNICESPTLNYGDKINAFVCDIGLFPAGTEIKCRAYARDLASYEVYSAEESFEVAAITILNTNLIINQPNTIEVEIDDPQGKAHFDNYYVEIESPTGGAIKVNKTEMACGYSGPIYECSFDVVPDDSWAAKANIIIYPRSVSDDPAVWKEVNVISDDDPPTVVITACNISKNDIVGDACDAYGGDMISDGGFALDTDSITLVSIAGDASGIQNQKIFYWVDGTPFIEEWIIGGNTSTTKTITIGPYSAGALIEYQSEATDIWDNTALTSKYSFNVYSSECYNGSPKADLTSCAGGAGRCCAGICDETFDCALDNECREETCSGASWTCQAQNEGADCCDGADCDGCFAYSTGCDERDYSCLAGVCNPLITDQYVDVCGVVFDWRLWDYGCRNIPWFGWQCILDNNVNCRNPGNWDGDAVACNCDCDDYDIEETILNGNCEDSKDNDCDGLTDCEEPECDDEAPVTVISAFDSGGVPVPAGGDVLDTDTNRVSLTTTSVENSPCATSPNTLFEVKISYNENDGPWNLIFTCTDAGGDGKCDEDAAKNIANFSVEIPIDGFLAGTKVGYRSEATDTAPIPNTGVNEGFFNVISLECQAMPDLTPCTGGKCCAQVCDTNSQCSFDSGCSEESCLGTSWQRAPGNEGASCGTDWTKFLDIIIDNSNNPSELADYPVKLNIPHDTDMRPDFGDIRFVDENGNNLSYWIEEKTDSVSAAAWVRIISIPASKMEYIYMHYGNPAASSASDPSVCPDGVHNGYCCEFFDDFEDGDYTNNHLWIVGSGTYSAANGYLEHTSGMESLDIDCDEINTSLTNGLVLEFDAMFPNPFCIENTIRMRNSSGSTVMRGGTKQCDYDGEHYIYAHSSLAFNKVDQDIPDDVWRHFKVMHNNGTVSTDYDYGTASVSCSGAAEIDVSKIYIEGWQHSSGSKFDNIIVRKYADPPPAISIGSENTCPALDFDGADDYIDCGNGSSLDITGAITVEAWVKLNALGIHHRFVSKHKSTDYGWTFGTNLNYFFWGQSLDGSSWNTITGGTVLTTDTWYHMAAVFDDSANEMRIYLNGKSDAVPVTQSALYNSAENVRIGIDPWHKMNGAIDEVRIYNRALGAAEIEEHYNNVFNDNTGLTGLWHFDEGTSNTASDSSGQGNDGQLLPDGPSWTSGAGNIAPEPPGNSKALDFDGADDYVDCGNDASLNITGAVTIAAWVKGNNVGGSYDTIVLKERMGDIAPYKLALQDSTGYIYVSLRDAGGWHSVVSTTAPPSGEWHHVAGIIDVVNDTVRIYYDGFLVAENTSYTHDMPQNDGRLGIGAYLNNGTNVWSLFNGLIDEVRIYNRALSSDEILEHYNGTFTDETGLAGLWHFDEGTGNTAYDSSGQGNDGQLLPVGPAWSDNCPSFILSGDEKNIDYTPGCFPFDTGCEQREKPICGSGYCNISRDRNIDYCQDINYMDYDCGAFTKRAPITIDNSGNPSALTDYQVKLNIAYDPDMQPDFDDLRFVDKNGAILEYWLESKIDGVSAAVWVKVPLVPASGTEDIYMHYGNATAISASDFDNTFTKDYFGDLGLVGQWNMDEGSGTTTIDSSGQGNTGTFKGAGEPAWVGADGGWWNSRSDVAFSTGDSLDFDGTDDYVDCGNDASLDMGTGDFTIESWIKFLGLSDYIIAGKGAGWAGGKRYILPISSGNIIVEIDDNVNKKTVTSASTYNDNAWHYVVGVKSGNNLRLYIDGEEDTNSPVDVTGEGSIDSNRLCSIGAIFREDTEVLSDFFDGQIDEVRIYNRALSADEIKSHYERREYAVPEPTNSFGGEENVAESFCGIVSSDPDPSCDVEPPTVSIEAKDNTDAVILNGDEIHPSLTDKVALTSIALDNYILQSHQIQYRKNGGPWETCEDLNNNGAYDAGECTNNDPSFNLEVNSLSRSFISLKIGSFVHEDIIDYRGIAVDVAQPDFNTATVEKFFTAKIPNVPPTVTPIGVVKYPNGNDYYERNGADCCKALQIKVMWSYFDFEGDLQDAYQVEVHNNPIYSNLIFDSCDPPGSTCASGHSSKDKIIPTSVLEWNTNYWWRVKVFDGEDWSGFADGGSFKTPLHQYPRVDFTFAPDPSLLDAPVDVDFTQTSGCFTTDNPDTEVPCGTGGTKIINIGWDFYRETNLEPDPPNVGGEALDISISDGNGINPNDTYGHTFFINMPYPVYLQITDQDGYTCSVVKDITPGGMKHPWWREILPK